MAPSNCPHLGLLDPPTPLKITLGNLTLKTVGQSVHTWCWGLYLSGERTEVTLRGPTSICELFLSDGRLLVEGRSRTYNSLNSCTTVEVGRRNVMNSAGVEKSQSDGRYLLTKTVRSML